MTVSLTNPSFLQCGAVPRHSSFISTLWHWVEPLCGFVLAFLHPCSYKSYLCILKFFTCAYCELISHSAIEARNKRFTYLCLKVKSRFPMLIQTHVSSLSRTTGVVKQKGNFQYHKRSIN